MHSKGNWLAEYITAYECFYAIYLSNNGIGGNCLDKYL